MARAWHRDELIMQGDAWYFLHERLTQRVKNPIQHVGLRQCAPAQMRCSNLHKRSVALHCHVGSGSAQDAYDFYFSSAVVVYVALQHCVEVDRVPIEGGISTVWSIRSRAGISPVPDV